MTFEYAYKTPDGTRHVARMKARSKERVFASLRERGIKPIRVDRAKPEGVFGWLGYVLTSPLWVAVLVAAAATGVAVSVVVREKPRPAGVVRAFADGERFRELARQAEAVRTAHAEAFKSVDFELLRNYALIAQVDDLQRLNAEITKAKVVIANTRERLRALFGGVAEAFAGDPKGLAAAQALYGEVVSEVDADEAQVESDEAAIVLLSENRDKWKVVKGRIVFSDDALRRDFAPLAQAVDPSTARWHKDFGGTAIESNVIKVTFPKK